MKYKSVKFNHSDSIKIRELPKKKSSIKRSLSRNNTEKKDDKKEKIMSVSHNISQELADKLHLQSGSKKLARTINYIDLNSSVNYVEVREKFYDSITRKLINKPLTFFLGKEIKVGFIVYNSKTFSYVVEWMWLVVLDIDLSNDCIVAKLINNSFFESNMKYGDIICVKKNMIGLVADPYDVELYMVVNKYYFITDPASAYNAMSDYILQLNLLMD